MYHHLFTQKFRRNSRNYVIKLDSSASRTRESGNLRKRKKLSVIRVAGALDARIDEDARYLVIDRDAIERFANEEKQPRRARVNQICVFACIPRVASRYIHVATFAVCLRGRQ